MVFFCFICSLQISWGRKLQNHIVKYTCNLNFSSFHFFCSTLHNIYFYNSWCFIAHSMITCFRQSDFHFEFRFCFFRGLSWLIPYSCWFWMPLIGGKCGSGRRTCLSRLWLYWVGVAFHMHFRQGLKVIEYDGFNEVCWSCDYIGRHILNRRIKLLSDHHHVVLGFIFIETWQD